MKLTLILLLALAQDSAQVNASWGAHSEPVTYEWFADGLSGQTVDTFASQVFPVADTAQPFTFCVAAIDSVGNRSGDTCVNGEIPARFVPDTVPPSAPSGLDVQVDTFSVSVNDTTSVAWFVEDFSSYGSVSGDPTQDFRNDINSRWAPREIAGSENKATIELDTIPGLGERQVYRQAQWLQCKPGSGTGYELSLPNPEQEIWVEVYIKFSPTYRTDWEPECGDVANPDHKLIFFSRHGGTAGSRWQFKVGVFGHGHRFNGPTADYDMGHGELPNPCFNDVWQRWRIHLKGSSGANDGFGEAHRIDPITGEIMKASCSNLPNRDYRMRFDGEADQHDGFYRLDLGVTFNVGPQADQHWQYGPIRVWKSDPGWGW